MLKQRETAEELVALGKNELRRISSAEGSTVCEKGRRRSDLRASDRGPAAPRATGPQAKTLPLPAPPSQASGKPGAFQPGPRPQVLGVSSEPLLRTTLRRVTSPSRAQGKKGPKRAHQPLRLALGRSRREAAEGRRAARRQSPSGPEPGRLLAGRVRIGRMQRRQSIGKDNLPAPSLDSLARV